VGTANVGIQVSDEGRNAVSNVRLYRMSTAEHDCPWGLKAAELLKRRGIPFEDHPLTSEEAIEAFKTAHGVTTTPQIFSGPERIGGYSDLAQRLGERAESADYSYTPVMAVFGSTLLMALVLAGPILRQFMGLSICVLAILKLIDLSSFAESFSKYDLISQRWRGWGKVYPGVELLIGLGFLSATPVPLAGWIAVVVGIPGMVSVLKAVYVDKLALNCACVGGNSKTPLGIISFSEYAMLTLMGWAIGAGASG